MRKIFLSTLLLAVLGAFSLPALPAFAQTTTTPTAVSIPNPIPCADATCVISQVIKYVLGTIALIATGMFIYGGFLMLTSAGNEKRVTQARETLAWAAIGIVVILLSWAIIRFVLSSLLQSPHK